MKVNTPDRIYLGKSLNMVVGEIVSQYERRESGYELFPFKEGERSACGFRIPTWQRQLVWTEEQKISFLKNLWVGVPVGTYTYVLVYDNPEIDGLLIDGQQRISAIQQYLEDKIELFGGYFSDLDEVQKRMFNSLSFPCYIIESNVTMDYLKNYYNLMNFSGVRHTEVDKA